MSDDWVDLPEIKVAPKLSAIPKVSERVRSDLMYDAKIQEVRLTKKLLSDEMTADVFFTLVRTVRDDRDAKLKRLEELYDGGF
jgi:hypothetical protein